MLMLKARNEVGSIATLTIRNVESRTKEALRVQAARNGRSMEAELRAILRVNVQAGPQAEIDLFSAIRRHVEPFGGFEIPQTPDIPCPDPPRFE